MSVLPILCRGLEARFTLPNPSFKKDASHVLEVVKTLAAKAHGTDSISIEQIYDEFGQNNHFALIAFLCLPFFQPIPLPGLSVFIGLLIVIICGLLALKKEPRLPTFLKSKKIKSQALIRILNLTSTHWPRIQKVMRKRLPIWSAHGPVFSANLLVIAFAAILLALPLPVPATNSTPALVIFLNSLGQIEEDGVLILASYVVLLFVVLFFTALAYSARNLMF